ncbi:hypothetical protein Tco_1089417 [Tanacetum coccineum]
MSRALRTDVKRLSERRCRFNIARFKRVQSSVTSSEDETSSGIVSDEEIEKQKLEAHYSCMAKIQDVSPEESIMIGGKQYDNKSNLRKANASLISRLIGAAKLTLMRLVRALGEATSRRDSSSDCTLDKQTELRNVNARTKKPHVVPISASKPKRKANKSVATPHKKTVASDTTIQKSKSYYKKLYENTNQEWKWWIAKRCPSVYTWTQKPLRTKKIWMPKIRKDDESTSISPTIDIVSRITNVLKISNFIGSNLSNVPSSSNSLADCTTHPIHSVQASVVNVKWCLLKITLQAPFLNVQMTFEHSSSSLGHQCQMTFEHSSSSLGHQCQMMSDHNSSDLAPQRQEMSVENVSSGLVPQGQKASDYDNSDPVPPRQNVVPTAEKTDSSQQGLEFLFSPLLEEYYNPTHDQAEENNNDQAPNASFQEDEFINPFCTRVQEIGESSSRNIDNTDVHSFQPQSHDYRWTRDHPLEQVRGNPTMPVQTRRQLATDPEMCMFACSR